MFDSIRFNQSKFIAYKGVFVHSSLTYITYGVTSVNTLTYNYPKC